MRETWVQSLIQGDSHIPWSNYAHARQLLSLYSRAQEPQLLTPHAAATETRVATACAPQRDARASQLEGSPHLPQLEKSLTAMKTQHNQI